MDGGLSWADQWDYNTPDPPPPPKDENDKKGKDSKNKASVLADSCFTGMEFDQISAHDDVHSGLFGLTIELCNKL
ncbi:hypothetical protein FRX31_016286 [Thalictrum thalictroides]|uniref:Uncharacterized protein n=1 Tax=Thalictrum thalictroides TaxID=46969 RepID=A0A7J6WD46_THATH|nr:hypothetical protein FRX31_016286 [Thalictrum thalictroides]